MVWCGCSQRCGHHCQLLQMLLLLLTAPALLPALMHCQQPSSHEQANTAARSSSQHVLPAGILDTKQLILPLFRVSQALRRFVNMPAAALSLSSLPMSP